MSSDARTQSALRARAVPGAPVEALIARTDELARRWAIGLILALPLERIGELPLETFAAEAPSFCAQVIRALASEEELERISSASEPGGAPSPARRFAEMTGARDGTRAVAAVEALRGVLWEALLDELRWSSFDQLAAPRIVADLADRLAYVCSTALGSSLTEPPSADVSIRAARSEAQAARAGVQAARADAQAARADAHSSRAGTNAALAGLTRAGSDVLAAASPEQPRAAARPGVQRASLGNGVVIVDEAQPTPSRSQINTRAASIEAGAVTPRVSPPPRVPPLDSSSRRARGRALPWDTPLERSSDVRDERS